MTRIDTLDVGELWFYGGPGAVITACVGARSLLVAYDTFGRRDEVVAGFRSAHAWLVGEESSPPAGLHLVFAAEERWLGKLFVALLAPGDWSGIASMVPLPPPNHVQPPGWDD